MRTVPLKSKFGCRRCKGRRKKCDEVKPVCGECSRLGFLCQWVLPPGQERTEVISSTRSSTTPDSDAGEGEAATVTRSFSTHLATKSVELWIQPRRASTYDDPSILQTDAVPDNGTVGCKHILQYLSERGTSMLRVASTRLPTGRELNFFRAGFQMAKRSPVHLNAYLCLGAGHLSRIDPSYEKTALRHYTMVMNSLRKNLMCQPDVPPAEWVCAVAAVLAFYELVVFHSAQSRLTHLVGFHRLVEIRLGHKSAWSPLKLLLEQYMHSMVIGSLFHPQMLIGAKPITYIDDIIDILNDEPRPLGREIAGVPEELTSVVYKLAFLNLHDTRYSPWDAELVAVAAKLDHWKPAPHTLLPSGSGLLLVARLYHLACICLLQVVTDRVAGLANETVFTCLQQAEVFLEDNPLRLRPFNSMVWPLTILSIFSLDKSQLLLFKQPILLLAEMEKVQGYRTILSFLSTVEIEKTGPAVLLRPDLLSMVHM